MKEGADLGGLWVAPISSALASEIAVREHYMHRRPPIVHAYGLVRDGACVGIMTLGVPGSRHLQKGACPSDPQRVLELNRLWVADTEGRNAESWFIARALRMTPAAIIVSYADVAYGHKGYVYRAANFRYAGWTDMERKTPRFDYIVPGKHTRDAFRNGAGVESKKVRRMPKVKYWTITGDKRERRALEKMAGWPSYSWKDMPPPDQHIKFEMGQLEKAGAA